MKSEAVKSENVVKSEHGFKSEDPSSRVEIDPNQYLKHQSMKAMGVIADELPNCLVEPFVNYLMREDSVSTQNLSSFFGGPPVKNEGEEDHTAAAAHAGNPESVLENQVMTSDLTKKRVSHGEPAAQSNGLFNGGSAPPAGGKKSVQTNANKGKKQS